jgi:recombinational DNA repair protein RecR
MSTLETQYKSFLSNNPDSEFTFEEWKDYKAKNIQESITRMTRENDLCEKHWVLKREGTCVKCIDENNK